MQLLRRRFWTTLSAIRVDEVCRTLRSRSSSRSSRNSRSFSVLFEQCGLLLRTRHGVKGQHLLLLRLLRGRVRIPANGATNTHKDERYTDEHQKMANDIVKIRKL